MVASCRAASKNRSHGGVAGTSCCMLALIKQGLQPVGSTPDAFGAYIKSELAKWTRVFRETGLQAEQVR